MTAYEERLRYLLKRFADNMATEAEVNEMIDLLQAGRENPELEEFLLRLRSGLNRDHLAALDKEKLWQGIQRQKEDVAPVRRIQWRWMAAAAVVLVLAGIGGFFLVFNRQVHPTEVVKTGPVKDVEAPKKIKATITLANGRTVAVDSIASGMLAKQSDVTVTKSADGKISYTGTAEEMVFNTLTNPRGSQVIDMTLTDGTRVWLNAGSSITYPVVFTGTERKVSVTGEAYFEVTHNPAKPFIVSKGKIDIAVLGTRFNVNAYDDEPDIKVTLLEGRVKVSDLNTQRSETIKPGQQVIVDDSRLTIHDNIDLDAVMAWKNGLFYFENADLQTVMKYLARWYDLDIAYEGSVPQRKFEGKIQRELNLSDVLHALGKNQVHYKIEGKKLTLMP